MYINTNIHIYMRVLSIWICMRVLGPPDIARIATQLRSINAPHPYHSHNSVCVCVSPFFHFSF